MAAAKPVLLRNELSQHQGSVRYPPAASLNVKLLMRQLIWNWQQPGFPEAHQSLHTGMSLVLRVSRNLSPQERPKIRRGIAFQVTGEVRDEMQAIREPSVTVTSGVYGGCSDIEYCGNE